ncbi:nitrous oxide reductase accessory protein NosL [Marinobacter sp. M216]|uniref:Nitrous oxide reductase accessory protein NosL n=1 Tax=Marinobacter albus TaxID=3030833 RepID=A0ABT7H8T3_9GAMM|nr:MULTISPECIES: nitrous oxide reductase accessory protein NosL [unclassified Marinobacter]MBW7470966.1 nitrous oxide reductase accessory protein NosL [Marinobacter sp. F4218]MDK9556754.1 nitrous oxide reductase accessory protein NosL [Marinobacter sp. M216]
MYCTNQYLRLGFLILTTFLFAACGNNGEQADAKPQPVHFASGDECHVCGMVIEGFPGPKGEAITGKDQRVRKFCSTRDMFAWMLQPENVNRAHTLYVHDMAQTDWQSPDDAALINAREAFYVVDSERDGAMGPTLASFAEQAAAEVFRKKYGGQVLSYGEVTLEHINTEMPKGDMHDMGDMDASAMEQ